MNRYSIAAGLMALLFSLPGSAGIVAGNTGECGLARDPLRCLAMQKARSACKEKRGKGKQKCLQEQLASPDCAGDKEPSRCEARQVAREACRGKTGKALQSCQRDLGLAEGRTVRERK